MNHVVPYILALVYRTTWMNAHVARRPAYTHAVKTHDDVVRYMQGRSQAWASGSSSRKRPLSPPRNENKPVG